MLVYSLYHGNCCCSQNARLLMCCERSTDAASDAQRCCTDPNTYGNLHRMLRACDVCTWLLLVTACDVCTSLLLPTLVQVLTVNSCSTSAGIVCHNKCCFKLQLLLLVRRFHTILVRRCWSPACSTIILSLDCAYAQLHLLHTASTILVLCCRTPA